MKTHIIENGIVTNTILASVTDAQQAFPAAICVDASTGGAIGDTWDGVSFTSPVIVPTRESMKAARQVLVDAIKVTVNGKVFDGDEISQGRMARAIIGMQATDQDTFLWVLADNTEAQVSLSELTQALCLAGQAQADVWVIP